MSEPYELYLRAMRRVGHYRWFSLFMAHVGSRVDRALIRASRGRLSMGGPQLTTMLLTTKGSVSVTDSETNYRLRPLLHPGRSQQPWVDPWRDVLRDPPAYAGRQEGGVGADRGADPVGRIDPWQIIARRAR